MLKLRKIHLLYIKPQSKQHYLFHKSFIRFPAETTLNTTPFTSIDYGKIIESHNAYRSTTVIYFQHHLQLEATLVAVSSIFSHSIYNNTVINMSNTSHALLSYEHAYIEKKEVKRIITHVMLERNEKKVYRL